ncbi:MAG: diacylglycerol kinase family protein [Chthoniobacteraceae bacterium]
MDDILIIINPAARSDRARSMHQKFAALPNARIEPTTGPGDAGRIAQRAAAEGRRLVVAAGGDGTINEVVNGLAGSGTALGILPAGTMNVFATELGLPGDFEKAWAIIEAGRTRTIDLALANDQYFVQLAGVGFDAQVVERTTSEFKRNFGPLSYIFNAAHLAAQTPPRLIIEHDGFTHEGGLVLIGNGRYYGMPLEMFADARLDDGLLDVVIAREVNHLALLRLFSGVVTGTHMDFEDIDYFQTRELRVTSADEVPVEVDGELAGKLPATFRIAPHRLDVVVGES